MNNTTRKHPRTLQQAFGPYTSDQIETEPHFSPAARFVYAAVVVGLIALAVFGWLPGA